MMQGRSGDYQTGLLILVRMMWKAFLYYVGVRPQHFMARPVQTVLCLSPPKSAKAGTLKVSFTSTYGIDEVNKFPDVQTKYTQGFGGVYDSASFWPSWGPTVEAAKALDPTHPDKLYNQYAQGYQQGNQFKSSINLSGGTENALLTSSFSYFKQNGTIPFSDYQKYICPAGRPI